MTLLSRLIRAAVLFSVSGFVCLAVGWDVLKLPRPPLARLKRPYRVLNPLPPARCPLQY